MRNSRPERRPSCPGPRTAPISWPAAARAFPSATLPCETPPGPFPKSTRTGEGPGACATAFRRTSALTPPLPRRRSRWARPRRSRQASGASPGFTVPILWGSRRSTGAGTSSAAPKPQHAPGVERTARGTFPRIRHGLRDALRPVETHPSVPAGALTVREHWDEAAICVQPAAQFRGLGYRAIR